MNGGHRKLTISRYDEKYVLYSTEEAGWYFEDSEVTEGYVDVKVLDEILFMLMAKELVLNWTKKTCIYY